MNTRVTVVHARELGYCLKGIRRWFDGRERSWLEFVEHGVDSDWLRATGDAMAIRLADLAEGGVRAEDDR
ncbi:MAG: hypothetical protein V5B34_15155 [Accumulibacter sp.]|jgi:hypothetical protein